MRRILTVLLMAAICSLTIGVSTAEADRLTVDPPRQERGDKVKIKGTTRCRPYVYIRS